MTQETAEKAKQILSEMYRLDNIISEMTREESCWWSFCTPRCGRDELIMPTILRKEFEQAVIRAKEKLQEELEKL